MFHYRWLETTLDKLAEIYVELEVADRDRLAGAVERLNARLETEPLELGESRVGGYRVTFLPLVMVTFYVDAAAREVEVTGVTRYGR